MTAFFLLALKAFVFGVVLAALPGPIFFLVLQRTITEGVRVGLLCGLGVVLADGCYACMAVMGLGMIAHSIQEYQAYYALAAGIYLVYWGVKTFLQTVSLRSPTALHTGNLMRACVSTFFLTMVNPLTFLSFVAFFLSIELDVAKTVAGWSVLIVGIILGVSMVNGLIVVLGTLFRRTFSRAVLNGMSRFMGLLLVGYGTWALIRGVTKLF